MNCAVHADTPATAFCRTCGKALCDNCKREVMGAIYCEPCIGARLHGVPGAIPASVPPPAASVPGAPSPGIALLLGFIPGVGAMYNGQFMKAFIHVVIFIMLVVASDNYGYLGVLVAFFLFYMVFDAYKTAEARKLGLPLPDPLGLDRMFGLQESQTASPAAPSAATVTAQQVPGISVYPAEPPAPPKANLPIGAIVLIALGALFLLDSIGLFSIHRLWPLFLIGVGLWLAYKHTAQRA